MADWILEKRPKQLTEVIGVSSFKDHIKSVFRGVSTFKKAYVFQGYTGTGKTTVAYILASYILNGFGSRATVNWDTEDGKAILNNEFNLSCKRIVNAGKQDLIQEIEQFVKHPSLLGSSKKVVIVEEAQELSKQAFNSLLSFLEDESTPDVHFIILSMGDIPQAIKGRCTTFKFNRLNVVDTILALKSFLEANNLWIGLSEEFQTEGLYRIALACEGSIRTGVNMLQQVYESGSFSDESLNNILETPSFSNIVSLLNLLCKGVGDEKSKSVVFEKISKLGITSDVYYMLRQVMLDCEAVKTFGKTFNGEDYFTKQAKVLLDNSNYERVSNLFTEMEERCRGYFSEYMLKKFFIDCAKN